MFVARKLMSQGSGLGDRSLPRLVMHAVSPITTHRARLANLPLCPTVLGYSILEL